MDIWIFGGRMDMVFGGRMDMVFGGRMDMVFGGRMDIWIFGGRMDMVFGGRMDICIFHLKRKYIINQTKEIGNYDQLGTHVGTRVIVNKGTPDHIQNLHSISVPSSIHH